MTDLDAARTTMALSLGFHIVLAAIGMVMPWLMVIAHRRWLRTRSDSAYKLTRAWARGVAIFFATGAVSGTALSFELGLLWPGFMEHAGPIIGMPFSLEGAAFFIEAIALGIYLYGWRRIPPKLHLTFGVIVGIAGVTSGILVISANGWMNSPSGFVWENGVAHSIDPWAALMNEAWLPEAGHMVIAAFEAVGFAVAGVHAFVILRGAQQSFHKAALRIALTVGAVAAILQPLHGHYLAQNVAERQPIKLAAMEAHFETSTHAPLWIGGIPDEENETVSWGIKIPSGLSFLAFNDPAAEVKGLNEVPKDEQPPVTIVHLAFQTMVGIGSLLAGLALLSLFAMRFRKHWLESRRFLWVLVLVAPLGFVAIEAGWIVTEVGRQPWIIYGIMKTKDALSPVPGQVYHLLFFAFLYAVIGVATALMWRKQVVVAATLSDADDATKRWAFGEER